MQILTRTYMVVIKDYDHMRTMDDNANMMKGMYTVNFFSKC